jgi:hypothetical protein
MVFRCQEERNANRKTRVVMSASQLSSGDPNFRGNATCLNLINLATLIEFTSGIPQIAIGLIDGPVAIEHPALNSNRLREIPREATGGCADPTSVACTHGTFVAGILLGKRGSAAPAICPECTLRTRQ